MRFAISVDIRATPEEVWYWLGDPERAKTWMTSVTHTEYIDRTPDMIGSTFRETVEEDGRGTELQGVIVDFAPNERMAFHLEGDYNTADVTFTLEEDEGITRLTQTADVRFKGIIRVLSLLFGRTFKKNITRQAEGEFATLKALCEAKRCQRGTK
ncbi:MAG: SRPBCC family protein [Chloroflexota bacterium]|nr:MAG: SRPBCC family protein [Chloroflexota bacterium]